MPRSISRKLSESYRDEEFLVRWKAMALFWICLGILPLLLGVLASDLRSGSASPLFYAAILLPLLVALGGGAFLVARGAYRKVVDPLFLVVGAIHLGAGLLLMRDGNLRAFHQGFALYAFPLLLATAVFARRQVFLPLAAAQILSIPLFPLLLPDRARPLQEALFAPGTWDAVLSRLILCGLSLSFVALVDQALFRLQRERDANHALSRDLERQVVERTRDLTEAKLAAEESTRARGRFIADLSHEIRTPIHGILGSTELYLAGSGGSISHTLEVVQDSAEHLLGLVQGVLDEASMEFGGLEVRPAPLEIRPFLRRFVRSIEVLAAGKGLYVSLRIENDVPERLMLDKLRLRQILVNIAGNAVKFTRRGGVSIRARLDADERLELEVADTGEGILPADLERIFGRLQRADTAQEGYGLGLSIVRALAASMGGEVEVASRPSRGSTFVVRLPASRVEPGSVSDTGEPNDRLRDVEVLVVDDDPVSRHLAGRMLANLGCNILVASSAEEALEHLRASPFHMALFDLHLPGLDGAEAARRIRGWQDSPDPLLRRASRIPLVAMTASAATSHLPPVPDAFDGTLHKPFRSSELADVVNTALLGRLAAR